MFAGVTDCSAVACDAFRLRAGAWDVQLSGDSIATRRFKLDDDLCEALFGATSCAVSRGEDSRLPPYQETVDRLVSGARALATFAVVTAVLGVIGVVLVHPKNDSTRLLNGCYTLIVAAVAAAVNVAVGLAYRDTFDVLGKQVFPVVLRTPEAMPTAYPSSCFYAQLVAMVVYVAGARRARALARSDEVRHVVLERAEEALAGEVEMGRVGDDSGGGREEVVVPELPAYAQQSQVLTRAAYEQAGERQGTTYS